MSRTYANFLLLEDVLDNLPKSNPVITQALNILLSPLVNIVEEDCHTLLGTTVDTSLELEGLIYVTDGSTLTLASIKQILAAGIYKIGIRELPSCNSSGLGGVCRKCYQGSYIGSVAPAVGTTMALTSSLIYQTDLITGTDYSSKFSLSQTTDDYYDIKVMNQGIVIPSSSYTLGYNYIQFPSVIPRDSVTGVYTVHFYQQNTEPFEGYICKTYSGSLLGIQPLPTLKPLLKPGLYESQFPDNFVAELSNALNPLTVIPTTYSDYVHRIHGKLEKVLLIMYLYAIYSNVQV